MYPSAEGDDRALRGRVLLATAAYFLLHVIIRVLVSGSTELDEAEQVLLTQQLAWGYGSQPPLYTWLQSALFHLFGLGILPLALLKNALLFCLYFFIFLTTREMTGEDRPAVAAMVSLLFIPQIAWESQRDLTHSVLGTAMMAVTLYAVARICRRGNIVDYLLFGLFAGLGVLGKYNVAVALAALLLAWLSLPEFRFRFVHPRILLSFAVFLLITGGHLGWALTHMNATLRQADTFQREALSVAWLDYLHGSAGLVRSIVSFVIPLAIVFLILFYRQSSNRIRNAGPFVALLARTLLFGVILCLAIVLFFRVTNLKDRWMQPILFATAIYLPLLFRRQLSGKGMQRLLGATAVVALLVMTLLPARTLLASHLKGRNQFNAPFDDLSEALRQAGFDHGNIAAGNRWLGGNLRLRFTNSSVFVPELPAPPVRPDGPWLVVWDATRKTEIPPELRQLCEKLPGCGGDALPVLSKLPPSIPMERCGLVFCCPHLKSVRLNATGRRPIIYSLPDKKKPSITRAGARSQ